MTSDPQILVVAALSRELAGIRREYGREPGSEANPGVALLETGEGIVNAERALEKWLELGKARAVLSIGFAGALSSSLKPGDVLIADEVRDSSKAPDAEMLSAARRALIDAPWIHFGVAMTANEIVWKAASKRVLAASLGGDRTGAVDMESTAIASVCERHDLPFLIARSITDLLDEDLPLDFNQFRNVDGRVDSGKVVRAALLKPGALRGLWQLRSRSQLCARRMGELVRRLIPLIG